MLSLPLPLVVALLLSLLLLQRRHRLFGLNRWLIALTIWQTAIVGLRFGYGVEGLAWIQPVTAMMIPPLAWLGLSGLRGLAGCPLRHALPIGLMLLTLVIPPLRWLIDPLLAISYVGYGVALLLALRGGADVLLAARLEQARTAWLAWRGIAVVFIVSALFDLAIALSFSQQGGAAVPMLLTLSGSVMLLVVGWASVAVAESQVEDELPESPETAAVAVEASQDDALALLQRLDQQMAEHHWYRDLDLNLTRLARLSKLPARRISETINRHHGVNVAQYVNGYRIREAQQRLRHETLPVTTIMYEVGFQTKSNFNREFLRLAGMSPSDWRSRG